jgi:hypothetical protein
MIGGEPRLVITSSNFSLSEIVLRRVVNIVPWLDWNRPK